MNGQYDKVVGLFREEFTGHEIILDRKYQKISFGLINQYYGTGVIEVIFP